MYVPLFVHSCYSLLQSTIRIDDLVKYCKELGITSVALTDYHNMFGAMEFSMACNKHGIQAILGSRIRMECGNEILVYCKNEQGYINISRLITKSYTATTEHKIEWADLHQNSTGILAIITPSILKDLTLSNMKQCATNAKDIEWYVGLEPNQRHLQESAYISQIFETAVVALPEIYFLHEDDQEAHDVLLCIKNQKRLIDENRIKSNERFRLLRPSEIEHAFSGYEFAIENTNIIASKCSFSLKPASPKLPKFGNDPDGELRNLAQIGFDSMLIPDDKQELYKNRLTFELDVISKMGFSGYFLIVSDFIQFARSQGIPISLRGSGAGSLVARCVHITEIDPIQFELFFERFLNPGRVSMPDFDIDFSPKGREKTINYVINKYGSDCVSGIITFGSLSSRAVLKDVGRVLHIPYSKLDDLSKRIQVLFGRPFSLKETYESDKEFASIIDSDELLQRAFKVAQKLEGLHRHASAHAAGIIIGDQPIYQTAPLYQDVNSTIPLVQFSMKYAELAGLVKFDFLGVTALDIIADTIELIRKVEPDFYLDSSSFNDQATYSFLRSGYTKGIFQFETFGMTRLIRDMEADCIEDLIATVSLYRPGPMDNIPLFIRCKKGIEKVNYIYPTLESILSNTYGIIVYQEQIIRIVQEIAGYTLTEADLLRRAIGKKIPEEMAKHKLDFIERAHKIQGGDIAKAEALFKLIETFANYGFNKAHAAAYAIVGYRGAYLKSHYPLYFLCVSMTAEQDNTDKLVELILEAKTMNISIDKPCINSSIERFIIVDGKILYSIAAIKNIGSHVVEQILRHRPFSSLHQLINKVNLNKREMEALVKSGALDIFGYNRGILMQMASLLMAKETILFDPLVFVNYNDTWSQLQCLLAQKEVLGLFLEGHPISIYNPTNLGAQILSKANLAIDQEKMPIMVMLENYSSKLGRRNNKYYIAHVSDMYGALDTMVLDESVIYSLSDLKGKVVWCIAQVRNGKAILRSITPIASKVNKITSFHIKINNADELHSFYDLFIKYKTDEGIAVYIHTDEVMFIGHVNQAMEFLTSLNTYKWYANF